MTTATVTETRAKAGKYLTFALGKEEYGIAILKVREIIGHMTITAVPRMPEFVRGVINLRGQVIPVVDLRSRFGMETKETTDQTCIIVVDIHHEGRSFHAGLIVDRVQEVLNITQDNIDDAPQFGAGVDTDFILGIGKAGSTIKILLDIDRVLEGMGTLMEGQV
jgi:purine-binding chemotaxis protein CheW